MDTDTRISDNRKGRKNNQKAVKTSLVVSDATWVRDYLVRVTFNDETEQVIDFGPYLAANSHPYIDPFKDPEQFRSFYIDGGNLVWGKEWDMIFPTWKLHRGYLDA